MRCEKPVITEKYIGNYMIYLREQERSRATLQKYQHDLCALMKFLQSSELTKTALISWKEKLIEEYAPASVNAMLAAVNGYLRFMGWMELVVKPLKMQRSLFLEEEKELTREEYIRLVRAAGAVFTTRTGKSLDRSNTVYAGKRKCIFRGGYG